MRVRTHDSVRNASTPQSANRAVAERLEGRQLMSAAVYADFDGDGRVDGADYVVLKADKDGDSDGNDFLAVVRPGNGDGTFGPAQPVSLDGIPGRVHSLAAGDFNGDGRVDLLTAGTFGRGVNERGIIGVLIGLAVDPTDPTGNTTDFADPLNFTKIGFELKGEPVVGDWNGDGRDDIAFANRQRRSLTALLLPAMSPPAAGEGPAAAPLAVQPVNIDLLGWSAGRVAAGDLNGDGRDDLAYIGGPERSLHLLENLGGGRWLDKSSPKLIRLEDVLISSVTDNGTEDLVVLRSVSEIAVTKVRATTFEGDPQRLLGLQVTTSNIDAQFRAGQPIALADVDGDGHADLFSPVPKNRPLLAFGDGTGAFARRA